VKIIFDLCDFTFCDDFCCTIRINPRIPVMWSIAIFICLVLGKKGLGQKSLRSTYFGQKTVITARCVCIYSRTPTYNYRISEVNDSIKVTPITLTLRIFALRLEIGILDTGQLLQKAQHPRDYSSSFLCETEFLSKSPITRSPLSEFGQALEMSYSDETVSL
jgi:hypothetical protein